MTNRSIVAYYVCVLLKVFLARYIRRYFHGFSVHSISNSLPYSGSLSTRMDTGLPYHSIISFRLRTTRIACSESSNSISRTSRLKSYRMFKLLNDRPSTSLSAMKLISHVWFGRTANANDLLNRKITRSLNKLVPICRHSSGHFNF